MVPGITLLADNTNLSSVTEDKTLRIGSTQSNNSRSQNIRGELLAERDSERCVSTCSFPKSALFFALPLALHYAIGVAALTIAFLIRKVPDNFRETFSILSLEVGAILLTILYVPLHYVVKNQPLELYAFLRVLFVILYTQI